MYDLPFQQAAANFPEETRLLCLVFRTLNCLESIRDAQVHARPRLSDEMGNVYRNLSRYAVAVDEELERPGRLRIWMDRDARAKKAPPRFALLLRLLTLTRRACTEVARVHDAAVLEEGEGPCTCAVCDQVAEMKWFLGHARRLLATAFSIIQNRAGIEGRPNRSIEGKKHGGIHIDE